METELTLAQAVIHRLHKVVQGLQQMKVAPRIVLGTLCLPLILVTQTGVWLGQVLAGLARLLYAAFRMIFQTALVLIALMYVSIKAIYSGSQK